MQLSFVDQRHLSRAQSCLKLGMLEEVNVDLDGISLATRRSESIEAAREILLEAEKRFPKEATIKFNLGGRDAAQLRNLDDARRYMQQAIELDKSFQKITLEDPDLESLWPPVLKISESDGRDKQPHSLWWG